jgi:hypothetical protein
MSGPKSSGYVVETAAAREARAYTAAVVAYEQTRHAIDLLRVDAVAAREVLGSAVPVPDRLRPAARVGRRSEQLVEADRAARALLVQAESRLHEVSAELARQRWHRTATSVVDDRPVEVVRSRTAATRPERAAGSDEPWRAAQLAQLAGIAEVWPTGSRSTVCDDALAAVRRAADPSAAALAVARARDELARIRAAQRVAQERLAVVTRLHAAVESVRAWQGEAATSEILRRLDAVAAAGEPVPEATVADIDGFVAAAHARRDRDEAGTILADVLTEMGYRLGAGFATRLSGPTDVLVGRSGWADHAVSVRLDDRGRVYTHVVRAAGAPEHDDGRVDAEFCTDFDALVSRAGRRGLVLNPLRRFAPGERALRAVEDQRVQEVAAGARQAPVRAREA